MTETFADAWRSMAPVVELVQQGEFGRALDELSDVPDSGEKFLLMAQLLSMMDRTDEAIEAYRSRIALAPDDPHAYADLAYSYMELGRIEDAIAALNEGLKHGPEEANLHRELGLALRLAGNFGAAMKAIDTALHYNRELLITWTAKADLLIEQDQYREAVDCLKQADTVSGLDASDWVDFGDKLIGAGAENQALECFDEAIKSDSSQLPAYYAKAWVYKLRGDDKLALDCYDQILAVNPQEVRVHLNMGEVLANSGDIEAALRHFDTAKKLNPQDALSLAWLGWCHMEQNRYQEALEDFTAATKIDPDYDFAWERRAECLDVTGQPLEAVASYRRAIDLNPDSIWAHNGLGWVLASKLNEREEALVHYEKAMQLAPDEALPARNMAWALVALERVDEAEALLDASLEVVKPEQLSDIYVVKAWILNDHRDRCEEALELYEKVEKESGSNDSLSLSISEVLIRLGRTEEARKRADAVLDSVGSDSVSSILAQFFLFVAYALEGNAEARRAHFTDFIQEIVSAEHVDIHWSFQPLLRSIRASEVDLAVKFVVTILADLQKKRLASPSLREMPEFRELLGPMADLADLPSLTAAPKEKGLLGAMMDRFRQLLSARA